MTNSNKLMCTAGENCPENLLKLKDTTLISEWIGFFVAEAFKVSGGRYPLTMYCVFYYDPLGQSEPITSQCGMACAMHAQSLPPPPTPPPHCHKPPHLRLSESLHSGTSFDL